MSDGQVKKENKSEDEEEDFGAAIARAKMEARQQDQARRSRSRQPSDAVQTIALDQKPSLRHGVKPKLEVATSVPERVNGGFQSTANIKDEEALREPHPSPLKSAVPKSASAISNKYAGLIISKKRKVDEQSMSESAAIPGDNLFVSDQSGGDEAKQRPAKRPFAPAKKPSKVHKPTYDKIETVDTRTTSKTPEWYEKVDLKMPVSRNDLVTLKHLFTLIKKASRGGDASQVFGGLRRRLHQMEFYDFLSGALVKKAKVLEDEGLPSIFRDVDAIGYPWDLKADAQALYLRWLSGVLDPHLLRGIITEQKRGAAITKRTTHKLDKSYSARVSCNYTGAGDLQNGQWWPMQICAMRDGAHGEIEAGIHGQPGGGAVSVLVSSGGYDDKDSGDSILYCGTSGHASKPSAGTNYLIEACTRKTPVRVLRSAALPSNNPYRPSKGLRYDGLYDIVSHEVLDHATAMYRFSLRRQTDQDPIRYQGVEARPTDEEIAAYTKIRGLLNIGS
ncbi:MAG: hypothetical protein M1836_005325 [Candelina mexicana]|nr:MAG: hypothetical protein M1836_005325 [Candelina mexicana]